MVLKIYSLKLFVQSITAIYILIMDWLLISLVADNLFAW